MIVACGPGNGFGDWAVPDLCFGPACTEHDEAYQRGGTEADRLAADRAFYVAMRAAVAAQRWWRRPGLRVAAWLYYRAVRHWGGMVFNYG